MIVAPTNWEKMDQIHNDLLKIVLAYARPISDGASSYDKLLQERLWLRGVNRNWRTIGKHFNHGLRIFGLQKMSELLSLSKDHNSSLIALPRVTGMWIDIQNETSEEVGVIRGELTRAILAEATGLENLLLSRGGKWTLSLDPGSLPQLRRVEMAGVGVGTAQSLFLPFASFSQYVLLCSHS